MKTFHRKYEGSWTQIVTVLAAAVIVGCSGARECDDCVDRLPIGANPAPGRVVQANITVGEALSAQGGEGVGVFVEAHNDGQWKIATSCDTNLSSLVCEMNVIVSVPTGQLMTDVTPVNLVAGQDTIVAGVGELELITTTAYELDAMTFRTKPGTPIRIEVYWDGEPDAHLLYWVGDDAVHQGAPTNPMDLIPSEP